MCLFNQQIKTNNIVFVVIFLCYLRGFPSIGYFHKKFLLAKSKFFLVFSPAYRWDRQAV